MVDILLIGNAGPALENLRSVIQGYPNLGTLRHSDCCMDGEEKASRWHPDLMLLANNLSQEEMIACARNLKKLRPGLISLAVLEDYRQYQRLLNDGNCEVIMNGFSVQDLYDRIDYLLVASARKPSNPDYAVGPAALIQ